MTETPKLQVDDSLFEGFIDESLEALAVVDELLVRLEKNPEDIHPVHEIFRPVHSIKGNAPFFGLTKLRVLAHELESLLALVRSGSRIASKPVMDVLLKGIDSIRAILHECRTNRRELVDEAAFDKLVNQIIQVRDKDTDGPDVDAVEQLVRQVLKLKDIVNSVPQPLRTDLEQILSLASRANQSAPVQTASEIGKEHSGPDTIAPAKTITEIPDSAPIVKGAPEEFGKTAGSRADSHKTMRVSEEHIDNFLSYVGELFTFGETLNYLIRRLALIDSRSELTFELTRQVESFKRLVQNMQQSVMSIRKVPVKTLLNKVPRMVRDIATSIGKEIEVKVEGQDIEVDKSLIELLDAPLTHMVRNAADHGIETLDNRKKNGKPDCGNILVKVSEEEKFIALEISDDGAGLNYSALQRKAESLGIIKGGDKLTENQIVDLIFAAGVSTAEAVTDISGRGVGMEVVKRAIEDSGGRIVVTTKSKEGTKFRIELVKSVTTNIVEGIIFRIGGQHFIVPADRVIEVSSFTSAEKLKVEGATFVKRHGYLVPIVLLQDIFHINLGTSNNVATHIITVRIQGRHIGLLVDEVLAMQQVVVKELRNLRLKKPVFTGATLIGDGQVALLIDVEALTLGEGCLAISRKGDSSAKNRAEGALSGSERSADTMRSYLLVESQARPYAIPLEEVYRLENVPHDMIEYSAGNPSLQYDESIMPLTPLKGSLSSDTGNSIRVVVAKRTHGFIGFVVDKILDIIERPEDRPERCDGLSDGYRGSTVIHGKVTDLISVQALAESLLH